MDLFFGFIDKLLLLMTEMSKGFDQIIVKYLVLYWFLYFGYFILSASYDLIIFIIRERLNLVFQHFLNSLKSIKSISFWAQLNYLIDRFFYSISLGIVGYGSSYRNKFKEHSKVGPIAYLKLLKSMFVNMFTVRIPNIVIWTLLILYFNPDWYNQLQDSGGLFDLGAILKFTQQLDFKKIIDNFSLILVLILGATGYNLLYLKAMKKVENDKYKKMVVYMEELINSLTEVLHASSENIDALSNHLGSSLTSDYCKLTTGTEKYYMSNNKLHSSNKQINSKTSLKDITEKYISFSDSFHRFQDTINKIHDENLQHIFFKISKNASYEFLHLGLYSPRITQFLENDLLNKQFLTEFYEGWTKQDFLKQDIQELNKVWCGQVDKKEFEKKYNSNILFEKLVSYAEDQLENKAIEFQLMAKHILIKAVENYINAEQYLQRFRSHQSLVKKIARL